MSIISSAMAFLPQGFVYLSDFDSSIQQSVRYYSENNFIGKRIEGYEAPKIILTQKAAEALKRVNAKLLSEGYEVVVYDGFRPQRAVNEFERWGHTKDDSQRALYFPGISKEDIFKRGFVAIKSSHSRGSTVDLTIIKKGQKVCNLHQESRNGVIFLDDCTLDMGMHFDFFGTESWAKSPLVSDEFNNRRAFLRKMMESEGFKVMEGEWWHFTLQNEPFPETYFDFIIK